MQEFDATITLNDHHLAAAGMTDRPPAAVAAGREGVRRMEGAGWIDVEAQSYPPHAPGWVIVYARGRSDIPDTPEWHNLRTRVETFVTAALVGAGVPF
jgi:hypothetical protein